MICPRVKGMRHERVRSMGIVAPAKGKRAVLKDGGTYMVYIILELVIVLCLYSKMQEKRGTYSFQEK